MSRSKWKNPYIKNLSDIKKNLTPVLNRNYEITPNNTGKTFKVYNGKSFIKLIITDEMIGHKAGEFVPTRIKFVFKKKRKVKKK